MTELGLSYVVHNPRLHDGEVWNEQTHDELLAFGGENQISFPVNHQNEKTLYESDDIVDYLAEQYG